MDDYRASSLFHGDSSYAPSSSAYLNPMVSPAPSSALDLDGRVVFKRQRLREYSPERAQDIWDWVRGVERRRHTNVNTPNSFVEENGWLREQPVNDSYLRTSPCHVPEIFTSSPMPCPLPERMSDDYEDDSSFAYPSRCSSTTLEHTSTAPARPAALNDPGMQSFLSWLGDEEEDPSKPPRFQVSPPVAEDYRCYEEDCMCSNCTSYRSSEQSGFRPPPLDIRDIPVPSYRDQMNDGNTAEMWSPPSLLSSSSSPPFRQSPPSPGQSCSPTEFRSVWDEEDFRDDSLHHGNSAYSPEFLSFSPFTGWRAEHDKSASPMDSPSLSSFSHIPLHQPQPVRPIILIRAPLLDPTDEQMSDDTEADAKLSISSSKAQRRRRHRNPNSITSLA